jgi:hypothetical protein
MKRNMVALGLTALAATFFVPSLWAFLDARTFFNEVATFEPYNEHLVHDIGAFQIGIGAMLAGTVWRRTGRSIRSAFRRWYRECLP